MPVGNVEILTVEEFLEFVLLILNIQFFKFVIIKIKFTLEQAMKSQRDRTCIVLLFF